MAFTLDNIDFSQTIIIQGQMRLDEEAFNINFATSLDQTELEVISQGLIQLIALISWIVESSVPPPTPPPPFAPVEVGGAIVEAAKVSITVEGTVSEWSSSGRQFSVRQAFAANLDVPVEIVQLTILEASRRRLAVAEAISSPLLPSRRKLADGVILNLAVLASSPAEAQALTTQLSTSVATADAATQIIQEAVPTATVLEVSPVIMGKVVLSAEEVEELPAEFVDSLEIEAEPSDDPMAGIIGGAVGGVVVIFGIVLVVICCKKSSGSKQKADLQMTGIPTAITTTSSIAATASVLDGPSSEGSNAPKTAAQPMHLFCSSCGKPLVADAKFCSVCGATVVAPTDESKV
jgi:hypothetical protein